MTPTVAWISDEQCLLVSRPTTAALRFDSGRYGFGPVGLDTVSEVGLIDLVAALMAACADEAAIEMGIVVEYSLPSQTPLSSKSAARWAMGAARGIRVVDLYDCEADGLLTFSFSAEYCQYADEAVITRLLEPIFEPTGARIRDIVVSEGSDEVSHPPMAAGLTLTIVEGGAVTIGNLAAAACLARDVLAVGEWTASPLTVLDRLQTVGCQALLGLYESDVIDFKRTEYTLESEAAAYEFALDVTSFANTETGGIIILGVDAERVADGRERASEIVGCRVGPDRSKRYRDKIDALVFPAIRNFTLHTLEHEGVQLLALMIPP